MNTKEKLLEILINNDSILSGEELGSLLNVSRKAIWKNIQSLKDEGYLIDSKQNGGYLLNKNINFFNSMILNTYLNKKLYIESFKEIDSTNTYAKKISVEKKDDFLICSSTQNKGRGRTGKSFYSPSGVYFSLAIKPIENIDYSLATIYAGLCVKHSLKKLYNIDCQIKWVNDIYYNGLKSGGILSEAILDYETNKIETLIVGIGININVESFPNELNNIATTFKIDDVDVNLLVATCVNEFYYLINNPSIEYINEYNDCLVLKDKLVNFTINGTIYEGIAKKINENGNLIVLVNGQEMILKSGEVSLGSKKYEK